MAEPKKKSHIYNDELNKWISFIKRAGVWEFFMMFVRHFGAARIIRGLPRRTIEFKGEALAYFYHRYNITWVTERVIEVPIALSYLAKVLPGQALEVGNVLSHYFEPKHHVLDKFEPGPNVIQQDIIGFNPGRNYDLILSISTFEHIGFEDDGEPDPDKVVEAIEACRKLLAPGGVLVITVPFGYNKSLDSYVETGRIQPSKAHFFEKVNKCEWRECDLASAVRRHYCRPYPYANAIMVAEFAPTPGAPASKA